MLRTSTQSPTRSFMTSPFHRIDFASYFHLSSRPSPCGGIETIRDFSKSTSSLDPTLKLRSPHCSAYPNIFLLDPILSLSYTLHTHEKNSNPKAIMSQFDQPLVSVITPVFNGEKYLEECIRSVLAQTYQNFEYIIVNNCSTDRSLEIAQRYALQDGRVRIHDNTTFLTSLQNHNHSLKLMSADSKYCKFIHADDWLFPECIEAMVMLAEANPSVGIVSSYRLQETQVVPYGIHYSQSVIPGRSRAQEYLLGGWYTLGTPSSVMFINDLVRKYERFFNEAHPGADIEACLELLQHSDFGFVHHILTFSRVHPGSITSQISSVSMDISIFAHLFNKYGKIYLDAERYERGMKEVMDDYYRLLGRRVPDLGNKKFWEYHKISLKSLGHSLNWPRVLFSFLAQAFWRIIDCRKNLYHLLKLFRKQDRLIAQR